MSKEELIKKYGTNDSWNVEQYQEAEEIFKKFSDKKIESIDDLYEVVSNIMLEHGPDGHTDGSQIIALICWRLLKSG